MARKWWTPPGGVGGDLHVAARHHGGEHGAALDRGGPRRQLHRPPMGGRRVCALSRRWCWLPARSPTGWGRRLFAVGLAVFSVASGLAAISPDSTFLNVSRAIQHHRRRGDVRPARTDRPGVPRRTRAWSRDGLRRTIGVAVAIGPLVGGALTDSLGWESVFYLNVPIGIAAIAVTYAKLRESRDPNATESTGPAWRPSARPCSRWFWRCCGATTRAGEAR